MYLHRPRVGLGELSIAVITGGNSGIGRAAAVALAERGFDVGIVWYSEEERAREAVAECEAHGVRAEARQADLEQVPGADTVIDELAEALGGIDALVNNAGAGHTAPFLELELERFRRVLGGLTKQMAFELGEHGILVNSVAPGEIATKMTGQEDEDPRGNERPVPVGRPGDAREVGALIAFLASPDNGYVTGQSYVVDGGMLVTTAQTR